MISADQPKCFPDELVVAVSSKQDGTMLDRERDFHDDTVLENRRQYCKNASIPYDMCVYQLIQYGKNQAFNTLTHVTQADTTPFRKEIAGDGLFTNEEGVGLFLPVADCVATVVYDPKNHFLASLHMGRHSTLTDLIAKTIGYFIAQGSNANDVLVWMSPSAKRESYRLEWFDKEHETVWQPFIEKHDGGIYLDLPGYNRQRFIDSGVLASNIDISPVDTMKDEQYFSHLNGDTRGRIAVVSMMRSS